MGQRFHNTLTGSVEPFRPAEPGHAKVYVCGPTVYDHAHIGHMRCYLVYDVMVRHLRDSGLKVTYIRNITDVNDSIIRRAAELGEAPEALAVRMTQSFHEDVRRMGYLEPDAEPKVSDHVPQIVKLIQTLIDKQKAYASDGDVYFNVQAFDGYGKLSHRKLDDLQEGASGRLDDEERKRKRHPADFALWKGAGPDELHWDSPWGKGRPGWHIECSAMSMQHLGDRFDLHGGGLDLVFPHHENEIAQSEAATGCCPAPMWVHNGFIEVNKEKMSKSLGNFFTAREAFRLVEPEAMRYFMMSVHYRAPLNLDWSVDDAGQVTGFPQIEEAERRVEYVYRTRQRLQEIPDSRLSDEGPTPEGVSQLHRRIRAALSDDLNMPVALAAVADFLKQANELVDATKRKKGKAPKQAVDAAAQAFRVLGTVLGLGNQEPDALLGRIRQRRAAALGLSEAQVEERLAQRIQARLDKDFAQADAIREELAAQGIDLQDSPDGTLWRIP